MIGGALDLAVGLLVLGGGGFGLAAAIGLMRLPDLFTRMHAASKAGALGAGLMLLALALGSGELGVALRALAGIGFILLTTPVAAHLLAKAALDAGQEPWLAPARQDAGAADQGVGGPHQQ